MQQRSTTQGAERELAARFPGRPVKTIIFSGTRLPFNGLAGETEIDIVIGTLRRIETMEFRVLLTGHSGPSNLAELVGYRTFLEALRAQVLQACREGRTVQENEEGPHDAGHISGTG